MALCFNLEMTGGGPDMIFKTVCLIVVAALVHGFSVCTALAQDRSADRGLYYVANTRPPDAYLALRSHPTTARGLRITTMPNGTALRVLERRPDGWWYVKLDASGQEGWALAFQGNRTWIECCITASVPPSSPQTANELVGFRTPSSNIHCQLFEGKSDRGQPYRSLRCDVMQMSNRPPVRPRDCDLDWGRAFEVSDSSAMGERLCYGDTVHDESLLTLSYGNLWERSGFRCKSEPSGVTCINSAGHGFELSRTAQRVF
jgi:hypothetical protein